jgi:hypothetical protein
LQFGDHRCWCGKYGTFGHDSRPSVWRCSVHENVEAQQRA